MLLKKEKYNDPSGFSLIELIVVGGIIVLVTTIVLVRSSKFDSTVLLSTLAYDIALSVRQAQVFGLSVSEAPGGGFDFGYGIHFSTSDPINYILFVDSGLTQNVYDPGSDEESDGIVEQFTLTRGNSISNLCDISSGDLSCGVDCSGLLDLDVVFVRPSPEAFINENISAAKICVASPDGSQKSIVVRSTGQISVE